MSHPRSQKALGIAGVVAVSLLSLAPSAWAQAADEQALQYRREAMEHALATRERYDLYGIRFDVDILRTSFETWVAKVERGFDK